MQQESEPTKLAELSEEELDLVAGGEGSMIDPNGVRGG